MPTRMLPRTEDNRSKALAACNTAINAIPQAGWLITAEQKTTLEAQINPWNTLRAEAAEKLKAQTRSTEIIQTAMAAAAQYTSHFIQVLNMAVARKELSPSERAHYQLPVSHAEVPDLNTCADVALWSTKLATGEVARVTEGGTPMAWPSISQITNSATACANAESQQIAAKNAYDDAQKAIELARPAVDDLIKDLWDTIEYNLRHEEIESRRRKAREWGVQYDDDPTEAEPTPPPAPPTP